MYQRNLIGTYVDSTSAKHDLYRIYYNFNDNIAANSYVTHNVGLSDCYILSADFNMYRSDAAGVISLANDQDVFMAVFTGNGDVLRFINKLSQAQNCRIFGVIECYKIATQS